MMLKLSYEDILNKIIQEKSISKEELTSKIEAKQKQLSDLISKEGAAHIIANELGVKVYEEKYRDIKIRELMPGVRGINIKGRIIKKYDTRSYDTGKRQGRIGSILIGDATAVIRVVAWDESQIDLIETLNENDSIFIKDIYVRENNGYKEIHLNNRSSIEKIEEEIKVRDFNEKPNLFKKQIKDLQAGDFATVSGIIVQAFEPRFYDACPECNKKVLFENNSYICDQHGKVNHKKVPVLTIQVDDGTDNIRATFFRDDVEKVLKTNVEELRQNPVKFEDVRKEILGQHIIVGGKVNKNEMFDRLEIIASTSDEQNPRAIAEGMLKGLEGFN